MLPEKVKAYLLMALAGAPDVFEDLLAGTTEEEADRRPEQDRFTIREAIAHLADWEEIFLERLTVSISQENPLLADIDEGQMAIDRDYAHRDWREQLQRYRRGRSAISTFFHSLAPEQWERAATHAKAGRMTVADQAALIAGHDGYHMAQVIAWRKSGKSAPD